MEILAFFVNRIIMECRKHSAKEESPVNCQSAMEAIRSGATALGIELGSTRIKAVLIDKSHRVLATGAFSWENSL